MKKKLYIIKGLQRSHTSNFIVWPYFLRKIRHITIWAERWILIIHNLSPSFYTIKITCVHSSYTPRVCHALPQISKWTATELHYIKFTSTKLNILSIWNICCSTKMYSSTTNSPTTQFYSSLCRHVDRDISNRICNLELIISTEVTCCHRHFLHSSKLLVLFQISFLPLTYRFHFRICWGSLTLATTLSLVLYEDCWLIPHPDRFTPGIVPVPIL